VAGTRAKCELRCCLSIMWTRFAENANLAGESPDSKYPRAQACEPPIPHSLEFDT